MKFLFGLVSLCLASSAMAFDTHGSIVLGQQYEPLLRKTVPKAGLVTSVGLGLGIGVWSYIGVGRTLEDDEWSSAAIGADWSFARLTLGTSYTVSRDLKRFNIEKQDNTQLIGMTAKVRLW